MDVQFGYFARPTLAFHTLALYQKTYGGWSNDQIDAAEKNDRVLFSHHDQLSADSHLNVGAGMSFTIRSSTDVSLTYLRSLWGRNGHKLDHSINAGVDWNFSAAQLLRRFVGKGAHMMPVTPDRPKQAQIRESL